MRQRWLAPALIVLSMFAPPHVRAADDHLTVQLNWRPDARVAGILAARDKGFYREAHLEVSLLPGGPNLRPSAAIKSGEADIAIDWLAEALNAREHGVPMVNVAQIQQTSALQLVCRRDAKISSTRDFAGHTLAVWPNGMDLPLRQLLAKLQIPSDGRTLGVKLVNQGDGVSDLFNGRAHCISALSYAGFWSVLDGGLSPEDITLFDFAAEGVGMPEDGVYVSDRKLDSPAFADRIARFIGATTRGWIWVLGHQAEAVRVVMGYDITGHENAAEQTRTLLEYEKLVSDGKTPLMYLRPDSYEAAVSLMMLSKTAPIIEKHPTRAYTSALWQASRAYLGTPAPLR